MGKRLCKLDKTIELVKEPLVNLGHGPNLIDRVARVKSIGNSKRRWSDGVLKLRVNVNRHESISRVETKIVVVSGADSLLDSLFKSTANRHDFTNRLHGRRKFLRDTSKLLQIPTGILTTT